MFEVKVDDRSVRLRLDAMPDQVKEALRSIAQTLDNELLSRVQANTPVRTGRLRSSFRGHVRVSKTRVTGTVDIDKSIKGERGIGAIIEYGAHRPSHEILPDVRQALKFMGSAGETFAAHVQAPASDVQAYSMLRGALDEMEPEIVADMERAVNTALSG